MNRRAFVKFAGCVAGAVAAMPIVGTLTEKKYGRINIQEHEIARRAHASLDGVDVGDQCYEADDINGYVLLYSTDASGRNILNEEGDEFLRERREGKVRIWVDA